MGYVEAMRTGKRHIESFLKLNVSFFLSLSLFSLKPVHRYYSSIYLSLANKCITAGQSVNCLIITAGQSVNCLSTELTRNRRGRR